MRTRFLLALFVCLAIFPLTGFAKSCTPRFPLQPGKPLGWQGADDAYSIPLPDGRDIWIFGDTLYGPERVVHGRAPRMVHNTLGISTCDAQGNFHLQYVILHNAKGEAESYFSPKKPDHWYWAMDGFVHGKDLWVTLLCIRHAPQQQPWAMDFATCGADLARVSHLDRDPQQWDVQYYPLVADGVKSYPSASAVVSGKYVYLFSLYESDGRPLQVTRIPLTGLKDPRKNLEYLAADGSWKPGYDPAKAKTIMQPGSTELSVRYHPGLKQWLAIMVRPDGFSDQVVLRTAADLTGPWSEPKVIYHIPEMLPGPGRDAATFCYAGKEHPEFGTPGQLVFTYVCNTMDVPKLATKYDIYFPRVVQVPLPK